VREDLKRLLPLRRGSQRCPDCDEFITADAMNIREGVALCPGCGTLSRLSELNTSARSIGEILSRPPSGCSIVSDGQRVTVTASMRSLAGFLLPAAFALFWNSITLLFVLIAIAGLYANLVGPLPNWFPAPGMKDGKPEMNGGPMDLGETLFLCIFLIPFVAVGIGMVAAAVLNLLGKVELIIDEFDSYVVTGVGFLKWKKRFDPSEVKAVVFGARAWQSEGQSNKIIEISADRSVKFGSMLQSDRLEWLRAALREIFFANGRDSRLPNLSVPHWLSQNAP
jgi:hypothetical protein